MRPLHSCAAGALLLALTHAAYASEWNCKFRAERGGTIDTAGVQKIVLRTGAGDLKVTGRSEARIDAQGEACASSQELLDATSISVRREGTTAFVETMIPVEQMKAQRGNAYAYIDVRAMLPANLPVDAQDSSGDAELSGLAELTMRDSSGDLDIDRIKGALAIQDSSGEIRVREVGSVRLEDSSGDMTIEQVAGVVDIVSDSSGDIEVRDIGGQVDIRQDSSGDIRANNVRGSVIIGVDSSGSIYARNVTGDFTVETDGSGSIEHEDVKGRISMPENK
jgi:hypothetical protein